MSNSRIRRLCSRTWLWLLPVLATGCLLSACGDDDDDDFSGTYNVTLSQTITNDCDILEECFFEGTDNDVWNVDHNGNRIVITTSGGGLIEGSISGNRMTIVDSSSDGSFCDVAGCTASEDVSATFTFSGRSFSGSGTLVTRISPQNCSDFDSLRCTLNLQVTGNRR